MNKKLQCHRQTGQVPETRVAAPDRCVIVADGVMVHTDGDWHEARVGTVRSDIPRPAGLFEDAPSTSLPHRRAAGARRDPLPAFPRPDDWWNYRDSLKRPYRTP